MRVLTRLPSISLSVRLLERPRKDTPELPSLLQVRFRLGLVSSRSRISRAPLVWITFWSITVIEEGAFCTEVAMDGIEVIRISSSAMFSTTSCAWATGAQTMSAPLRKEEASGGGDQGHRDAACDNLRHG
nr:MULTISPECIES: hypothetical protein [unclassified Paracoccus (in: a-proteobacteria)]